MCKFIRRLFNRKRVEKLKLRIAELESTINLFQITEIENQNVEKLVYELSHDDYYADLISQYKVVKQKVN